MHAVALVLDFVDLEAKTLGPFLESHLQHHGASSYEFRISEQRRAVSPVAFRSIEPMSNGYFSVRRVLYLMIVVGIARVQKGRDAVLHSKQRSLQGVELVTRYVPGDKFNVHLGCAWISSAGFSAEGKDTARQDYLKKRGYLLAGLMSRSQNFQMTSLTH